MKSFLRILNKNRVLVQAIYHRSFKNYIIFSVLVFSLAYHKNRTLEPTRIFFPLLTTKIKTSGLLKHLKGFKTSVKITPLL